jgi:hypothetical protein
MTESKPKISQKYFDHLMNNYKQMEEDVANFNEEILTLINTRTDWMSSVLKSHLIIEYYIDEYLKAAYPTARNLADAKLTFSQKLELANGGGTIWIFYYKAVKSLNTLRNKFSHRLSYEVTTSDLSEIKKMMDIWRDAAGEERLEGLELLTWFTISVCGGLRSVIRDIKRYAKDNGLPGYLAWHKSMNEE